MTEKEIGKVGIDRAIPLHKALGPGLPEVVFLDKSSVWPYCYGMKSSTIKATYSLDPLPVRDTESLAKAWKVPKSEAVHRSVHAVSSRKEVLKALSCKRKEKGVNDRLYDRGYRINIPNQLIL